jgi:hypothetical protein
MANSFGEGDEGRLDRVKRHCLTTVGSNMAESSLDKGLGLLNGCHAFVSLEVDACSKIQGMDAHVL